MIHEKTDNFYNQKIYLSNIRESRFTFLANLCRGKNVMHIGCADSMVFNVESNLHIFLYKTGDNTYVDGLDIDANTIKLLSEACPGTYFTEYNQVNKSYDIVIVPEVMEHVPNVDLFLKDVFSITSKEYLFTVPNMSVVQIFCDDEYTLEMVHPDHKYWFSPYTLYNTIKPFIPENYKTKMFYLENKTQIGIYLQKKTDWELHVEEEERLKKEEDKVVL